MTGRHELIASLRGLRAYCAQIGPDTNWSVPTAFIEHIDKLLEVSSDNWALIVKEYEPKIGFRYKDHDGTVYSFFGLVHADDDYYYGLMSDDGKLTLASCVGGLEQMYERIPNGGRCDYCNRVYPVEGPQPCDRYRCPHGPNPL